MRYIRVPNRVFRFPTSFREADSGASAIEFAIVGGPFFFLILALMDMGLSQLTARSMELGMMGVAREVKTGRLRATSAEEFRTALCRHISGFASCNKIAFKVSKLSNFSEAKNIDPPDPEIPAGQQNPEAGFTPVSSDEIVLVQLTYKWSSFVPQLNLHGSQGGKIVSFDKILKSTDLFRNEPY